MNTVRKGNQFEKKALAIIENLKEGGLFGVKEYVTIIPKAKRYSNQRKSNIEFDLIIEFKPPNANRPMLTYFIECKNYNKRIPVGQIQKFHSDILQVSGVNAKGIFISNAPLQKSAYNTAESIGMMVIEADSVENFKIVLHKRSSEGKSSIPFIKGSEQGNTLDEGSRSIERLIDNELLKTLIQSNTKISFGIDKLSKKDITKIAETELSDIDKSLIRNAYGLDYDSVKKYIENKYQVTIEHFNPDENKLLGFCDIDNCKIGVSKSIINTQRELFVLCHELGHFLLHQKLYIDQQIFDMFSDSNLDLITGKNRLENPRHWIEWQANYFSISFLVPQSSLMAKLWQAQQRKNLTTGNLYIDDQRENQKNFREIIAYLSDHFNVSKTSIIYRLKEFELITDDSRTKRVSELISDYKSEYFV
ncbi:MAG: Zn-dependent peptidase ImmA (M78 family) [Dokdonia sp.]|jgi:Zn-dependent peptidase ImmA (M78 family)